MPYRWDTQTIVANYIIYLAYADEVFDIPKCMDALNNNMPAIGKHPDPNEHRHIHGFTPGWAEFVLAYTVGRFPEFCTYDQKGWTFEEVQAAAVFLYGGGSKKMQLVCEEDASLKALEDVKLAIFAAAVADMESKQGQTLQRRGSVERRKPDFTWGEEYSY